MSNLNEQKQFNEFSTVFFKDYSTNKETRDKLKGFLFHNISKYIEQGFTVYPRVNNFSGELFFINVNGEYKAGAIRDRETLKKVIRDGIIDKWGRQQNIFNFCFNPTEKNLIVVDIDNHNNKDTLTEFLDYYDSKKLKQEITKTLKNTLFCYTPRNGIHFYINNDLNLKHNDLIDFKKLGISVDYLFKNCTCIGSYKFIKRNFLTLAPYTAPKKINFNNLCEATLFKAPYTSTNNLNSFNNNINIIKKQARGNEQNDKGQPYWIRDLESIFKKATENIYYASRGNYHDFILHFCILVRNINRDETKPYFYNSNDVFNFLMSTSCRDHDTKDTRRIIKDILK